MYRRLLASGILLSALCSCGAQPAPEFFGAERFEAERDGRAYIVFKKATRFEIIRLGYAPRAEHDRIRETMLEVVEAETNCKVQPTTVQGDSVELRGSVSCP